ncbi:MAG TPA: heavy metal sensor histidine kinase [Bryobacteraceae bacterium]|nr:heavy metal sensor histidine kinase [Bryobacteraceae bacterium]
MSWKTPTDVFRYVCARPRGFSLAFRLTAWYTTSSFLLVAAATALLYFGLAANLKRLSERLLADELDVCRALVHERAGDSHALREEAEIDSAIRKYEKFYVRVIGERGAALATTEGMDEELSAARVARAAAENQGRVFWLESPGGTPYRVLVAAVPTGIGNRAWTLQVAVELAQENEVLGRYRMWVWAVLCAAAFFCPAVGYVIARRGTAPLRQVADTARHVSSSSLSQRIQSGGYPSEIAALADTFNAMLARLEESFARLSRFSADIAHELRTPVNNIRGESEVALAKARTAAEYHDALESCLEEAVRLSGLIESLLFLARSESPGDHLKRESLDVGALVSDVRDYYEAAASEAGVALEVQCGPNVSGHADRALLQRALGNLVQNALSHTPPGGAIRLAARRSGERLEIEIADTGTGISPGALPHVFDRFFRADPARARIAGGTGLGLAIVRQIVFLHRGDIQIASELGQGTTISITLPAAEPQIKPQPAPC